MSQLHSWFGPSALRHGTVRGACGGRARPLRWHCPAFGILSYMPPMAHLLWVQAPFAAVGAELSGVEGGGLQHHRELVGRPPSFRVLVGCRHHFPFQPPALTPNIESGNMNSRLLRNPGHALPVRRTHPPSDIILGRLATTTHWSAPSSPRICD
jgi:hypothetical protein